MRDQEMEKDQPLDDGMGQGAGSMEMAQAIAAVIGKTRQEWAAQVHASESAAVPCVKRSRLVRPYFRLVSAAKDDAIAKSKAQRANMDVSRAYAFDSQD